VVDLDPVNDYAHFGIGLCAMRTGDPDRARGHLKLATVMRPDDEAYRDALALVTE
jgi:Tfp pilus assembly protein PilF